MDEQQHHEELVKGITEQGNTVGIPAETQGSLVR